MVDEKRYEAYEQAAELMRELIRAPSFVDFLTLPAYERVLESEAKQLTA
jgi:malate synthase